MVMSKCSGFMIWLVLRQAIAIDVKLSQKQQSWHGAISAIRHEFSISRISGNRLKAIWCDSDALCLVGIDYLKDVLKEVQYKDAFK